MGSACGSMRRGYQQEQVDSFARAVNDEINRELSKEKNMTVLKLLLLGSGESGKSTIVKQMKILHSNGFTHDELVVKRTLIYTNMIQGMQDILTAMQFLHIPFKLDDSKFPIATAPSHIQEMASKLWLSKEPLTGTGLVPFPTSIRDAIAALWEDAGVRQCCQRRAEFQLDDSVLYFYNNLERVTAFDYVPTQDDVLHARQQTMGVVEAQFTFKSILLRVFDAGGQRSERRKWIHFFDDVFAVLFVTALSEYDQLLREDNCTNRMIESIRLFDIICNNPWFERAAMLLFLNKTDLMRIKIRHTNLTIAFPEYTGAQDYRTAVNYIMEKFHQVNRSSSKIIYTHETCATRTDQISHILSSVTDMCVNEITKMWGTGN